jgi:peroxiredoxin
VDSNRKDLYFRYLTAGFVLVVLCTVAVNAGSRSQEFSTRSPKVMAADFQLKDIDGKQFKLNDHRGKPVLLIFSATWCNNCRSEIPRLKSIYNRYSHLGLVVVNLYIQESGEKVAQYAARYQLPYRILLDPDGNISAASGIMGVPAMILIDREGHILCHYCRHIEDLLETLFTEKEKPPDPLPSSHERDRREKK